MFDDVTPTITAYLMKVAMLNTHLDSLPPSERALARAALNAPIAPIVLLHSEVNQMKAELATLREQRINHLAEQAYLFGLIADLRAQD